MSKKKKLFVIGGVLLGITAVFSSTYYVLEPLYRPAIVEKVVEAKPEYKPPVIKPIDANELIVLVNKARTDNGLPALAVNEKLNASACAKADDMIAKNYWSHDAPDGTTPWYFFDLVGYNYKTSGENLSHGFGTAQATVDGWMRSPTHRENILMTYYTEMGMCDRYEIYQGTYRVNLAVNHFGSQY